MTVPRVGVEYEGPAVVDIRLEEVGFGVREEAPLADPLLVPVIEPVIDAAGPEFVVEAETDGAVVEVVLMTENPVHTPLVEVSRIRTKRLKHLT
jgi:hypothetical protein